MLLSLFIVFLTLSIALIALGYYTKEAVYSLVGSSALFLLGASILITGNLQYETGSTTSEYNSYIPVLNLISNSTTITTITQANYNDITSRLLGIWLGLLGAFTIAINIFEIRGLTPD